MNARPIRVFIGEPTTIDPACGFEHDGTLILRFLADPLVDFTADTGDLRPAAARSWKVDPDGRRVVFELRDDVVFHHGRKVTAHDYVYSLSRVVQPGTASKLAYNLAMIEGYEAVRSGAASVLAGVTALGDHLLEVRLGRPFHEIAALFGHRVTAPVPRELVESDPESFKRAPVSTGPYMVADPWKAGVGLALKKFDGYYGKNAAYRDGGSGHVERLEFCVYQDVDDAFVAWHRGALDVTKVPPARIVESLVEGPSFRQTPCALMQYVGFPVTVAPFDNPIVRRAVAMCIDRQAIIDEAFHGTRPIAQRIIPPGIGGASADLNLTSIRYDPRAARELLKEHGLTEPVHTGFRYNAGLGHDGWVHTVVDSINTELGWEVQAVPMDWRDFLVWLRNADEPFRMTWAIDYPSVDNFLYPLFHSESIGNDNFTGYRSADFDDYIERARSTASTAVRNELYLQAEQLICTELPLVPLWFGVQYHLVNARDFVLPEVPVDLFGEPSLRMFRTEGGQ